MASVYPNAVDNFTDPLANSPLNSPSHAQLHTDVNDALEKIETFVPRRNLIYNGAMQVHQRGTSSSGLGATSGYFTADRWTSVFSGSSSDRYTQSIENDAPTGSGFRKSLKMLCTTAQASPGTSSATRIDYRFEGQDLQSVCKGTSSAQQLTLSFWVKTNVTGTYIALLQDSDNNRRVAASYTVSSSGTWEKKILVFPADTTGPFDNDNNQSLVLCFWLVAGTNFTSGTLATTWQSTVSANEAVGQVNLASAINNYWQVTGVQLNVGNVPAPFEFKSFGQELAECQRYYEKSYPVATAPGTNTAEGIVYWWGSSQSDGVAGALVTFKTTKRVATGYVVSTWTQTGTAGSWDFLRSGVAGTAATTLLGSGDNSVAIFHNCGANNATVRVAGHWAVNAEL